MFLVPLPQSPPEEPAVAPVSSNLHLTARVWSTITLRLCLQFLTISSCPPFYNPWILPFLQETQHMPQKTLQYRVLSLQRLLLWFPFLLNHSKVSREISGIASDWNSYSWDWNCPCVSSICRKRTISLGGWRALYPQAETTAQESFPSSTLSSLITHRFPVLSLPIKKQCQGGWGGWKPYFKH